MTQGNHGGLKAVLFDMDGTLVDTEPYWIESEHALVAEFGGTWSDEHAHALVGNPLIVSAAYIREHGPVPLAPEEIVERMLDHVVRSAREHLPWRPGALELLTDLRDAGIPCALVTMSYDVLAQTMINQLPAGTFAAVVTGDQVTDGKPHPEAYLTAAARLGVGASECIAIEDSPTGVRSAEAAGCVVVAIPHAVALPPAPTRILRASMTELNLAELANIYSERTTTAQRP